MILRNREVGEKDGFYGCLLRTAHQEILVHVFGVSFDDANGKCDGLPHVFLFVWFPQV